MITGDNELTALAVARQCGMIGPTERVIRIELDEAGVDLRWQYDEPGHTSTNEVAFTESEDVHFVTTGKVIEVIRSRYPSILKRVVARSTVLARMTPDFKTRFVEDLQVGDVS